MALDRKNLLTLAKTVANASPSVQTKFSFAGEDFSYENLNETLRQELYELASDYRTYQINKNTIFQIMEQTIDDVLPTRVLQLWGQMANVKSIAQGQKYVFTQRITDASRRRAKQFITKVGLAGIYEVFKLDGKSYEIQTSAFGGAAQMGFEEFLDRRVQFSDVLDIMMTGLDECVYLEIERALRAAIKTLPAGNIAYVTGWFEQKMDELLTKVDAYGSKGVIYCTYELDAKMIPQGSDRWSDNMKESYQNKGYFTYYKGHQVVVLPQSFEDNDNLYKVINPRYAWILPSGGAKPVTIVLEGQTIVREIENADMSREIQAYKKMGVGALFTSNMAVYIDNEIPFNGAGADPDPRV